MAKPSTLPVWASDATYTSGPETGNATVVVPSAGYLSQGWVPGLNFASQYANYIVNLLAQWVAYLNLSGTDELTYAAARTRTVLLPLTGGSISQDSATFSVQVAEVNITSPSALGVSWVLPLRLPHGAILTGARAAVDPDNASGSCTIFALKTVVDKTAAPGAGSTTTLGTSSTSGTAAQIISAGAMSETIDNALNTYSIAVAGSVASAKLDKIHWVEVTYTETRATGHY